MKRLMFTVLLVAFMVITSCSDTGKLSASEVPQTVMQSFNAKYPGATDVQWKTEKHDGKMVYEAQFKMADKKVEAEFDEAGVFVREED